MGVLSENAIIGASAAGDYEIANSCRFEDGSSAYLSRTPASAGNRKTWTWAGWVKRGNLGSYQFIFSNGTNTASDGYMLIYFTDDDKLEILSSPDNAVNELRIKTTRVFRDVGAWYHLQVVLDTTEASSSNRLKIHISGTLESALDTATYPSQNTDMQLNRADSHEIGKDGRNWQGFYLDGYLADVHFIDGQALGPENFGETDDDYGHWKPIRYTGTYGTNGFYLDFKTASDLGNDVSGNNNDWTENNIGSTDQMLDSPTNNFAVMSPLDQVSSTLKEGNLLADTGGTASVVQTGTFGMASGKWYWEVLAKDFTTAATFMFGIKESEARDTHTWDDPNVYCYYGSNGNKYNDGDKGSYGATYTTNDIIGVAYDADAGKLTFYKNNSSQGDAFTGLSGTFLPYVGSGLYALESVFNFGQDSSFAGNKTAQGNTDANGIGDFFYAPPSDYLALCTKNLPDPTVKPQEHFNTVLYTGNGATRSITGVGFQPDWLWVKSRSTTTSQMLTDAVRGNTKYLFANLTNAEATSSIDVTSFDSDGFSLSTGASVNANTETFVAWNWKANGSGVSNTDGSITSTVSANTSAGFSIVSYTGNGSAGATVGHGLSSAPDMVIVKSRETLSSGTSNWQVGHDGMGGWGYRMKLEATEARVNNTVWWNDTAPSSSVFTLGSNTDANDNGKDMIAYCFHNVEGYSKFGSYTGNGSTDGPFVYCGFRPAFVVMKITNEGTTSWIMLDSKRQSYNALGPYLFPNLSNAEGDVDVLDFTSSGFKIRLVDNTVNMSNGTYIFMAFAENPFKFTNAR